MSTIGDRIRLKRKELGLTQVALADHIGVTDRAVSKWEINEGNPDLSIIPSLCSILGVTTDYLLLGKVEEPTISLEDMDSMKRAELLIKRDDVDNFVKFGYLKVTTLFDIKTIARSNISSDATYLRKLVIDNKSKKIFNRLLDDFVKSDMNSKPHLTRQELFSPAYYVLEYLDDFVKLCADIERIDALELINVRLFKIGESNILSKSSIRNSYQPYSISLETLSYLLRKESPKSVLNYFADFKFFELFIKSTPYGQSNSINIINSQQEQVIDLLYRNDHIEQIDKALQLLTENAKEGAKKFQEVGSNSSSTYLKEKKTIEDGVCFFTTINGNLTDKKAIVVIKPIISALQLAINDKDLENISKFNDYNKLLNNLFGIKHQILTQEDIEEIQMAKDSNVDAIQLKKRQCKRYGLTNCLAAISSPYDENDPESMRKAISYAKKIFKEIVENSYITYVEMIDDLLNSNNYREIIRFITDYGLDNLLVTVLKRDKNLILNDVVKIFGPTAYNRSGFLERGEKFEPLLRRQMLLISFEDFYGLSTVKSIVDFSKFKKHKILESYLTSLEEKIELVTKSKTMKAEYEKVTSEITFEIIDAEVIKGNTDIAIIKLCVLLEAILKYRFKYEGDLFEMLDSYMKNYLKPFEMINPYDDEDNNYYNDLETDRQNAKNNKEMKIQRELLHKLRMKRNSIVHPETNDISMTKEELSACIEIVKNMKGK